MIENDYEKDYYASFLFELPCIWLTIPSHLWFGNILHTNMKQSMRVAILFPKWKFIWFKINKALIMEQMSYTLFTFVSVDKRYMCARFCFCKLFSPGNFRYMWVFFIGPMDHPGPLEYKADPLCYRLIIATAETVFLRHWSQQPCLLYSFILDFLLCSWFFCLFVCFSTYEPAWEKVFKYSNNTDSRDWIITTKYLNLVSNSVGRADIKL